MVIYVNPNAGAAYIAALEIAKVNVVHVNLLNTGNCTKIEGLAGKAVQHKNMEKTCKINNSLELFKWSKNTGKANIKGINKYSLVFRILSGWNL